MKVRSSGILLHITCLPSVFGIGDLGPEAYRFADFLEETHQRFWQVLPLNPTDPDHFHSPYHSTSAFANNVLLISPEKMVEDGWITSADFPLQPRFPQERVDFATICAFKQILFDKAYDRFKTAARSAKFNKFCAQNAYWLEDYARFETLKTYYGRGWNKWPKGIRNRDPSTLKSISDDFKDSIEKHKFLQFIVSRQWMALKRYCNEKSIQIIGDVPIYLPYDSTDLWVHPELFKLDKNKKPVVVSGVPPDYFSSTGQLWGHPIYRWDVLQQNGYRWWIQRFQRNLNLFDIIRIDHFRGLVAYWEVPAKEKTAINGKWIKVPAEDFFEKLFRKFVSIPIIAEDLGTITPDVREIMNCYEFPGMRVLLFAFGDDFPESSFLPHHHVKNCVVFTGTHDNSTVQGWYVKEATPQNKENLYRYLGRYVLKKELHWEMIRLAMMSVANTVIIPLQDVLGLKEVARMNQPARSQGNWQWRFSAGSLPPAIRRKLIELTKTYNRA